VKLTIPPESDSGKVLRLRGLGMPLLSHPEKRGALYVNLLIQVPKNLTDKQKKQFKELSQEIK